MRYISKIMLTVGLLASSLASANEFYQGDFSQSSYSSNCCPSYDAACCSNYDPCCDFNWCGGWILEGRVAGFHPSESRYRRIYGSWIADYQIELGKEFCCNWEFWINGSYTHKKGRSIGLHDCTTIRHYPIALGLSYQTCFCNCWSAYAGLGASFGTLRIHDCSPFVHKHTRKGSVGCLAKLGVKYEINTCMFVDLFADYLYQPYRFHSDSLVERNSINAGGWKLGVGIGFKI